MFVERNPHFIILKKAFMFKKKAKMEIFNFLHFETIFVHLMFFMVLLHSKASREFSIYVACSLG